MECFCGVVVVVSGSFAVYHRSCWFWIKVREAAMSSQCDEGMGGKQYMQILFTGWKEYEVCATGSKMA